MSDKKLWLLFKYCFFNCVFLNVTLCVQCIKYKDECCLQNVTRVQNIDHTENQVMNNDVCAVQTYHSSITVMYTANYRLLLPGMNGMASSGPSYKYSMRWVLCIVSQKTLNDTPENIPFCLCHGTDKYIRVIFNHHMPNLFQTLRPKESLNTYIFITVAM